VLIRARHSDHIQQIGILHTWARREIPGGHGSTLETLEQNLGRLLAMGARRWSAKQERSNSMPLLQVVEVLVVVGVLLWLVNRFIPMQATMKSILNGVVIIGVVLWLLNAFGLFHSLSRMHT
jgi:hypothetical protein